MDLTILAIDGMASGLTVLLMQGIKKYDKKQRLKKIRVLLVFLVAAIVGVLVKLSGQFEWNEYPLHIAWIFAIALLFHNQILGRFEKKIDEPKVSKEPDMPPER